MDDSIPVCDQQVNSIRQTKERLCNNTHCALNGDPLSTSCPGQYGVADLPPRWCLWLGMTTKAWQGWRKLHANPLVAICYYFSANAGLHFASLWLWTSVAALGGIYLYISRFVFLGFIVLGIFVDLMFWRYGPDVVNYKLFPVAVALSAALLLTTLLLMSLEHMDTVSFQHRMLFACWGSCAAFFHSHSMAAGGAKGEHPLHPRTSIFWPFMRANVRAVQMVDALTDVEVMRTLMEQKASGCWWFGEEGNCQARTWLTAAFILFWGVKVTLTLGFMLLGGDSSGQSWEKQRLLFASEITALVCELAVACCTLLEIFSLRASGNHRDFDESKVKSQIALGVVSLITTSAALVIIIVGVSKTLRAMSTVWNNIQPTIVATTGVIGLPIFDNSSPQVGDLAVPFERDAD